MSKTVQKHTLAALFSFSHSLYVKDLLIVNSYTHTLFLDLFCLHIIALHTRNMKKFLIVAFIIKLAFADAVADIEHTPRYQLYESVIDKYLNIIWSPEIYQKAEEYINTLKKWSQSDERLQTTPIYNELQEEIEKCLQLLEALKKGQINSCQKQIALTKSHSNIGALLVSIKDETLRNDCVGKLFDFARPLRSFKAQRKEDFYKFLLQSMEKYLNENDSTVESEDVVEWYRKFSEQQNLFLVVKFIYLFPNERVHYVEKRKCQIQIVNGF
ncbi:uncharacterized protein LOC101887376 [Musca domestica]|uniref:Uncharacterized protein LOC101887376 n=1 Tax=Musca domestica TaxID=7370 RepID=A0A1I8N7G4_MUSDO|nr:uncharacterized protein LOC101887376 [Musca domestica]